MITMCCAAFNSSTIFEMRYHPASFLYPNRLWSPMPFRFLRKCVALGFSSVTSNQFQPPEPFADNCNKLLLFITVKHRRTDHFLH